MLQELIQHITITDCVALAIFVAGWIGYGSYADRSTEANRGIRALYFGFAAMTWFVSPQLFMGFTLLILLVLWRRDFHSRTLHVLLH